MANIKPAAPAEVALSGTADMVVDPSGVTRVELWERVLPFTPPAGPPPKFAPAGVFASHHPSGAMVAVGGLHQARLYREGQGNASGEKTAAGRAARPRGLPLPRARGRTRQLPHPLRSGAHD